MTDTCPADAGATQEDPRAFAFRSARFHVDASGLTVTETEIVATLRDCLCVAAPRGLRSRIILQIHRRVFRPDPDGVTENSAPGA